MSFSLLVDYREFKVIEELTQLKIKFENVNLPIGDFVIKNGESICYIIERKSISDLCSSITDLRFREQKARLLESIGDPDKIIYIIEGLKSTYKGNISKNIINGALLNLLFKHKYKIIFTETIQDTVDNLLLFYKKVSTDLFNINLIATPQIKLIKKSESSNTFVNLLSTITGVSVHIAKVIQSEYSSIHDLITKFGNNELLLSDLKINDKRKLGKALSIKIYKALHN